MTEQPSEPATARPSRTTTVLSVAFLALSMLGCVAVAIWFAGTPAPPTLRIVMTLIMAAGVLLFGYAAKWVAAYSTTFHRDRIVAVRGFKTVELPRNRIQGFRRDERHDRIALVPLDGGKPLFIHPAMPSKAFVEAWLAGLTDLGEA
ncbi:MAG: hypothetical protein JOZ72_06140 [Alphaproteobacteria bacterium]|nr:hypothetical protein [Alphaproteobacteria bacterium]